MTDKRLAVVIFIAVCCYSLSAQVKDSYSLRGTIMAGEGRVIEDRVLEVRGETIGELRPLPDHSNAIVTQSYILPGLVDLHDHIAWNVFPRWRTYMLFPNRYEWQQRADYKIALNTPHTLLGKEHQDECEANEYAEIKALVGGATSTVGSLGSGDIRCIEGVVRNLDFASGIVGRRSTMKYFLSASRSDGRIKSALTWEACRQFLSWHTSPRVSRATPPLLANSRVLSRADSFGPVHRLSTVWR
jgi:hypothetical protein